MFSGDFRQILMSTPKETKEVIIDAWINRTDLWSHFKMVNLTENASDFGVTAATKETKEFSKWVLDLGNGTVNCTYQYGRARVDQDTR